MAQEIPAYIYTTYIRTTPEKLWEALTNSDFTEKYWFGFRMEADWKKGGVLHLRAPKDLSSRIPGKIKPDAAGEVLAYDKPHRLAYTFPHSCSASEAPKRNGPSRVTIDLTPMGEMVKLRLVHENLIADDIAKDTTTWMGINNGWPGVLSSLKSLLETGKEITYSGKAG